MWLTSHAFKNIDTEWKTKTHEEEKHSENWRKTSKKVQKPGQGEKDYWLSRSVIYNDFCKAAHTHTHTP